MWNSLRTKIILITLFILLVTNGVNSYVNGIIFKNEYSAALKNEVAVIGNSLKLQLDRLLGLSIPLSEIFGFEEQCREVVKKYPYVSYAMVVDTNGLILFHSDLNKQNMMLQDEQLILSLKNSKESWVEYREQNKEYFRFIFPVRSNADSLLGAVVLGVPVGEINAKVSISLFYSFLISFIFFIMAFFLFTFTIGKWVTKPLIELEKATKNIFHHQFLSFQKVAVSSNDEIGCLTQSFNAMAEQLEATTVSKAYMDNIISSMIDSLFVVSPNFEITTVNHAACEITGYSAEELIGERFTRFLGQMQKSLFQNKDIAELIHHGELRNYETSLKRKCGTFIPIILSCSVMNDNSGKIIAIVITAKDITERKEAEKVLFKQTEELSLQATHDWLTGLFNRSYFEEQLRQIIEDAGKANSEHILFYMDLDQFKIINDTCGHSTGDQLLRQIAVIISQNIRKTDIFARLGGDEFGLLFRDCNLARATKIAENICQAVQNYRLFQKDQPLSCGISIGIVRIDSQYQSNDLVLSAADQACYVAKEKGGNRFQVFDEKDQELEERHDQMQLITVIRKALQDDRFCLHVQPIRAVNSGKEAVWYETLVRMLDDSNQLLYPNSFLQAAQRYKLIIDIDRWVFNQICHYVSQNRENDNLASSVIFNVNISAASLTDDSFREYIFKQIVDYQINPKTICFEITETMAITNFNKAVRFIERLKDYGCRFALDDFGSGLASFNYLKHLPVDYLKIDGNFIRNITHNHIDYCMVKGINEIAHEMKIETIAEFVETQEIFEMLKRINIDYAQGYWIAKPIPLESI